MSGFVRTKKIINTIVEDFKGSSGIPALDSLITLSPGTITAIYEDQYSFAHNTLLQIFISESLKSRKDKTFVVSKENKNFIYFNQKIDAIENEKELEDKKLLIAWRYKELNLKEKNFEYNLLDRKEVPDSLRIEDLIETLKNAKNSSFCVFSIFSPLFKIDSNQEKYLFLYEMRKYCKLNNNTVYLSIPKFLIDIDPSVFFDNIFELSSLLSMGLNKYYYSCLLELKKVSAMNTLRVNDLDSCKYGVKIRSKNVKVEKIDIPPEENDVQSTGCSGAF
jgi:PAXNEB protein